MGFWRLVWLASKRSGGLLSILFLVAASVTAYGQFRVLNQSSWASLVFFFTDAVLLYPAASGVGAWRGIQSGRTTVDELSQRTSRFGLGHNSIDIMSLGATILLGWSVSLLGPFAIAAGSGAWGRVPWELVLVSTAGMVAFATLGYIVGHFHALPYTPILAAVLGFGLLFIGDTLVIDQQRLAILFPDMVSDLVRPWFLAEPRIDVALVATGWLSSVTIALVIMMWAMRRRGVIGGIAAGVAMGTVLICGRATVLTGVEAADRPLEMIDVTERCIIGEIVSLCAHPLSFGALEAQARSLDALTAPMQGVFSSQLELWDILLLSSGNAPRNAIAIEISMESLDARSNALLIVSDQYQRPGVRMVFQMPRRWRSLVGLLRSRRLHAIGRIRSWWNSTGRLGVPAARVQMPLMTLTFQLLASSR